MELPERRRRNLRAFIKAFPVELPDRAALARKLGVSYAQLNQVIGKTPTRNIGEKVARKWETKLGLSPGWLDMEEAPEVVAETSSGYSVIANEPREFPVMGGAIAVDQLDVRASMGQGADLPERETVIDSIRVPVDYIRENFPTVTAAGNLKIITGFGDSMRPTYNHGDPLIVDTGVKAMDVDTVYVFAYQNELYIKRIQRLPDRSIKVISDNRAMYDPFVLDATQREDVQVIARVICAVNMNKIS